MSGEGGRWDRRSTAAMVEAGVIADDFYTFDMVQDQLVQAMEYQRRYPKGGAWPFASDGPWHLIVKDWWDWGAHDERPMPRVPLTDAQIAMMWATLEWLRHVPSPEDRRLVGMALRNLAAGRKTVPWTKLLKPMGVKRGAHALRKRYGRALNAICEALNAAETRA